MLEVAQLDIRPGQCDAFEAAFKRAQAIISSMPGYLSHQLQKCIEKDHRYLLLVQWETLEDHTEGFRQSPATRSGKRSCIISMSHFPM
ncbi:antibiotic biosynthesis monooxygenase family protein [Microbulbifer sp. YPW16]|uniref:antibiotic biosynthesis monooxygenase family protein n=1 Tax=Microbulbifer sp. YPW16 TaxID=2904242 RepID=UPI003F8D99E8